ncbi:U3 small nucleolar RNA-associated protein 10 [Aspergillus desertorum]
MASSLAAQLSQIAANSTNQLNLKAQRLAHSKSLIFDKRVAGSQDFDTIYDICYDGFRELCQLDPRFAQFERSIFSEQSKAQDRTEMNMEQNRELDLVLEAFLALAGGRLLLSPAVKAVEWLVRRFRVHEYNTRFTILTFLPYYSTPLFLNLLAILPEDLPPALKVLIPYKRSAINPVRQALVQNAISNRKLITTLNNYVLQVSRQRAHHHALLSFWAGIITEGVAGMLDSSRSGRRNVEKQKHDDIILQILPVLNDGLTMKDVSELVIGCYMVCVVLAQKADLQDRVLDGLMEAVTGSWTEETLGSGLICIAVLAQQKPEPVLPKRVFKAVLRLDDPLKQLAEISTQYKTSQLLLGLVAGCVDNLSAQRDSVRLDLLSLMFENQLLNDTDMAKAMALVLQAASGVDGTISLDAQTHLADLVQHFSRSDSLQPIFQKLIEESSIDLSVLEHNLQTAIESVPVSKAIEDVEMEDADKEGTATDGYDSALESLAKESSFGTSFLAAQSIPVFDKLVQAFALSAGSQERASSFVELPVLCKANATTSPQFLSFFIRVFTGPYPAGVKTAALKTITSIVNSAAWSEVDVQALLPFMLIALSDPSERVRSGAVDALANIGKVVGKKKKAGVWARDSLYGNNSKDIPWLSSSDFQKVLERAVLPELEECRSDGEHIGRALENALRGTASDSASTIKKPLRLAFFTYLCSHAVQLPLFAPKAGLLGLLNRVDKAGGTTRTKELEPLLKAWRNMSDKEVAEVHEREQISVSDFEVQVLKTVTPKEKESITLLLATVTPYSASLRASFVSSVFNRIGEIWGKVSEDRQIAAAEKLFELSIEVSEPPLVDNSRNLLRRLELPGPVLLNYLQQIPVSITDIDSLDPAPKRRRTSQNNMVAMTTKDEAKLSKLMDKMTFILELVDGSNPETHPELTEGLFQTLAALHHFKSQIQSGMSYLLSLTLGSLLAIVNRSRASSKPQFDTSAVRADLVVDCVRTTESPQVQNTALLLVAGLSVIAPELILHSVMPIFTFMGSSVLRKDDDYSVSVIDQTIDQVVPALIQSLRHQKRDVVSGTSELLLSFTAAFEHIPSHRRLRLFHALITKLGTEEFLFAVLAMLANRYSMDKAVLVLMTGLVSDADATVELSTYSKFLNLVADSLKSKPGISQVLLGIGSDDGREPHKVAVDLLRALAYLFKHSSLKVKIARALTTETEDAEQIRAIFSRILEQVLAIGEFMQGVKPVHQAAGDVLSGLFSTLTTIDFLDTIEALLKRPDDALRRKVLSLLAARLQQSPERDGASQMRMLDFLTVLVDIVQSSSDILLKHAAVTCIDRIADKYGKKEPSMVTSAAQVVASGSCIGQEDDRIRINGVLCLASMVEVLGQAMIPALPEVLSRSLALLELSLENNKVNARLHDAVFTLFSALFVHLPYMVSASHLDRLLVLSFKSAASDEDLDNDNRLEALRFMARKVDMAVAFASIERNWAQAVSAGPSAIREVLDAISLSIEKHPKSATMKNLSVLTTILFRAFDLRREQSLSPKSAFDTSDLEEIEDLINDVTIKMIYKLNDTTFRPIFIKLVEWATGLAKKDTQGGLARLTTFYRFLQVFFGTLQSIVTGYASYIIESVVSVLGTASPSNPNTKSLWLATMRMLRSAFEHDQDEFWQSPSHITKISTPLISHLRHATSATTGELIATETIPTITELAVAADSTDNHKELNAVLMRFLRPSSVSLSSGSSKKTGPVFGGDNPHTRIAALKTEQALTEQLGEDWLALLPEMLPYISELMEDEDEGVEREVRKWVKQIEGVLGERLDDMLT